MKIKKSKPGIVANAQAGQRLAALAQRAFGAGEPEEAAEAAEDALNDLVAGHLDAHRDGALSHALRVLDHTGAAPEVADELLFSINDSADHVPALLASAAGEVAPGEATLFAIPVILVLDAGEIPAALTDVAALTGGLRGHGLVGPEPSLLLLPQLLSPDQADLFPSERRHLARSLVAAMGGGPAPIFPGPEADRPDAPPPEGRCSALRFLVGLAVAGLDDPSTPFCAGVAGAADDDQAIQACADAYDERAALWSREAGAEIVRQLGPGQAMVCSPESLGDAFKTGLDAFREFGLGWAMEQAGQEAARRASGFSSELRPVGQPELEAVEVLFQDDRGEALGSYRWVLHPYHDDPEGTLEAIDAFLASAAPEPEAEREAAARVVARHLIN